MHTAPAVVGPLKQNVEQGWPRLLSSGTFCGSIWKLKVYYPRAPRARAGAGAATALVKRTLPTQPRPVTPASAAAIAEQTSSLHTFYIILYDELSPTPILRYSAVKATFNLTILYKMERFQRTLFTLHIRSVTNERRYLLSIRIHKRFFYLRRRRA